jgi:asparagine synthase (glutamine-hydrolysing)
MAAGVEGREPLANYWVFDAAIKFSGEELMGNGRGKMPLRKLLAQTEGHKFAFSEKVGFPVDLNKIFKVTEEQTNYETWFNINVGALIK